MSGDIPTPLRLALVGCGAISERGHAPAAARVPPVRLTALVDREGARARRLAERHPGAEPYEEVRGILDRVDAAVVALPPFLHASTSIELLQRGIHVLVEKPMAGSAEECDAMIAAARASGAVLAVGLMRRFSPAYRLAKRVIDAGTLGPIQSFDVHEGGVFDWPVTSGFFLKREQAGGGVLADLGAHVLDALLWWFGDATGIECRLDDFGGVEADCELELVMETGVRGRVALSRTRGMRNTTIIRGERGTLEISSYKNWATLSLPDASEELRLASAVGITGSGASRNGALPGLLADQLADFAAAIREGRAPAVPGEEGRRSVRAIERCYAAGQPLRHPWVFCGPAADRTDPARTAAAGSPGRLAGKTVLVTGATGFIGGRLVERLVLDEGASVRALVRDFGKASRLGRFDLELVGGDVTDPAAVRSAAQGCDVIVHCAVGASGTPREQRAATVDGTRHVVQAALASGVERLVHVSTMSVYGHPAVPELTEEAPRRKTGDLYGDTKVEAEDIALEAHRREGLPVAVIQPTIVYGPFGGFWTAGQLEWLRRGLALPEGGAGACNVVYVDDVVEAALLAAVVEQAVGQAVLVSGPQPVTWGDFYGAYERMLGVPGIVPMSVEEIRRRQRVRGEGLLRWALRTVREDEEVRSRLIESPLGFPYRLASRLLPAALVGRLKRRALGRAPEGGGIEIAAAPEAAGGAEDRPMVVPDAGMLGQFTSRTRVSIAKARRVLGYEPRYALEGGMSLTEEWARWAGHIP